MPSPPRHQVSGHGPAGGPQPALHFRGVLLPQGEHRDLWIRAGTVTFEPVAAATTVSTGGWILPGLVDLHCHVGLDRHGAVPADVARAQALTDRDAGVLLLRDAGSPSDTRWMDEQADLPRIVRAGRHLARPTRYLRGYGHEIEPEQLEEYVLAQARFGDGWVKLVGDWIDRERGDLAPSWPRWALDAAIRAAHSHGARVTAHVFGEEALEDLLGAGIDCIEHGTGLDDDLLAVMARDNVSLVPTLINTANFPAFAEAGARFAAYAAHMRALHARRRQVIASAIDAGVSLYAGTDAGGYMAHGLIASEAAALAEMGLPNPQAVGAASWQARRFLLGGSGLLEEGSPGDLIVVDADPLLDISALAHPGVVVLRGRVVARRR